ncbi:MAG: hypothetical protein J6386_04580 [Candidatus Synoicihabitans palmerolidicus]|nr:hypothetical protein [Candidatus Synoicihabitans palmerolidicus]
MFVSLALGLFAADDPTPPVTTPASLPAVVSVPSTEPPAAAAPLAAHYTEATVQTAKTSIYIGAVTLRMAPFERQGDRYHSTYSGQSISVLFLQ